MTDKTNVPHTASDAAEPTPDARTVVMPEQPELAPHASSFAEGRGALHYGEPGSDW